MAEYLLHGKNVARPEVDAGDDLFVFEEGAGGLVSVERVQVKTCRVKTLKDGAYTGQFNIPVHQLSAPTEPELTYVFAFRAQGEWAGFVIIPRSDLYEEYVDHQAGALSAEGRVNVRLRLERGRVTAKHGRRDLSHFLNRW